MTLADLITYAIPLLIQIESNGNPKALGDNGLAVGLLQIHEIVVEDVNRIYGTSFTSADRWDEDKSIEICRLYLMHYGKNAKTVFDLGRIWNGGPKGMERNGTLQYAEKMEGIIHDRGKT